MKPRTPTLVLAALLVLAGCNTSPPPVKPDPAASVNPLDVPCLRITLTGSMTIDDIGAGQGAAVDPPFLYLYGDADTGIIREYDLAAARDSRLVPTGRFVRLTRNGVDLASHPTGLAINRELGTFLGDTVNQKGTLYHIDWDVALADSTLDHAVINVIRDDAGVNGTRPEYCLYDGRPAIATSDYGDRGNRIRLYDPERLARASRTKSKGVLLASFPCGPFVQSIEWLETSGVLVLVQNQIAGLESRLTTVKIDPSGVAGCVLDLDRPTDELEGFVNLGRGRCLLITSSSARNIWFGEFSFDSDELAAAPGAAIHHSGPLVYRP